MSSYAHVVHTTAKQVISRRRKNENVYKISKTEKCTCKACKNTVFRANLWGLCCRRKFSPKFAKFSYPPLGQEQKCSMACPSFKNLIQVLVLNFKAMFSARVKVSKNDFYIVLARKQQKCFSFSIIYNYSISFTASFDLYMMVIQYY